MFCFILVRKVKTKGKRLEFLQLTIQRIKEDVLYDAQLIFILSYKSGRITNILIAAKCFVVFAEATGIQESLRPYFRPRRQILN